MSPMSMFRAIGSLAKNLASRIELAKYDNFTIAEYFRKQGAQIGEGCYIVPRRLGDEPYLIKIGNHVCISGGVNFHTHDGGVWVFRNELPGMRVFGPIVIGDNCLIGERVIILPNVNIGANSIVGAGSVVISEVPANSVVMGVPARAFGSIERYKAKCMERWEQQRPRDFQFDHVASWEASKKTREIRDQVENHLKRLFKGDLG